MFISFILYLVHFSLLLKGFVMSFVFFWEEQTGNDGF